MKAVLVLALLVPVMASATTSYLCVADKATGFIFNRASGNWDTTTFNPRGKYLLSARTEKESPSSKWLVREVGDTFPSYFCLGDFSEAGQIYCRGFGEFRFSREAGRFLVTYTQGYVVGKVNGKEAEDTPSMEIGKCSPIN